MQNVHCRDAAKSRVKAFWYAKYQTILWIMMMAISGAMALKFQGGLKDEHDCAAPRNW
jgi:hypothetical protein